MKFEDMKSSKQGGVGKQFAQFVKVGYNRAASKHNCIYSFSKEILVELFL